MELGRRDALAALAAVGTAGAGAVAYDRLSDSGDEPLGAGTVATLVAVAEVVYPSDVDGISEFVETYSVGRVSGRPSYAEGVSAAVEDLDGAATDWYGGPYRELDAGTRDDLLVELGCDQADADPAGTTAERLRYFLVNELLYALYTSPTGGELVGIENPQGQPGGTTSYQRGPDA